MFSDLYFVVSLAPMLYLVYLYALPPAWFMAQPRRQIGEAVKKTYVLQKGLNSNIFTYLDTGVQKTNKQTKANSIFLQWSPKLNVVKKKLLGLTQVKLDLKLAGSVIYIGFQAVTFAEWIQSHVEQALEWG